MKLCQTNVKYCLLVHEWEEAFLQAKLCMIYTVVNRILRMQKKLFQL